MATKIVTKNSSTASAVPTASDLVQGELAVNVADKRLFTEDNGGSIVELGTNPSTIDINAGTIDGTAIGASSASTGAFTTLTATGIDVTGTATMDGLVVNTGSYGAVEAGSGRMYGSSSHGLVIQGSGTTNDFLFLGSDGSDSFRIANNGDISFYEDTGTTAKLFWDASAESLGIGTSSPAQALQVNGRIRVSTDGSNGGDLSVDASGLAFSTIGSTQPILFERNNYTAESMRIDSSGNVGIGTTSPQGPLHVYGSEYAYIGPNVAGVTPHSTTQGIALGWNKSSGQGESIIAFNKGAGATGGLVFADNNGGTYAERMRIDSSGNVKIGNANKGVSDADEGVLFSGALPGLSYFTRDGGLATSHARLNSYGGVIRVVANGNSAGQIGSGSSGALSFYNGAGSSERMRIDSSGSVGIGISSPTADLHVRRASNGTESNAHFKIAGGASTYTAHHWLDATAYYIGQSAMSRRVRIYSGAEASGVNLNAGATSWGTFSDERLKYDVEPVENAVESLSNLRTVKYRLKDVDSAEDKKKIGLMAQDLVGVLDEVIDPLKRTGDDTEYMSVRYTELVPVLVKAIQEQQTLIESLTDRIAALEE